MREDITASDITISAANVEDTNRAGKRSEKLTRKTTAIPSENNSETRSEDNSGKKEKTVGKKSTVKTIEKNSVNGTVNGDLRAKKETAVGQNENLCEESITKVPETNERLSDKESEKVITWEEKSGIITVKAETKSLPLNEKTENGKSQGESSGSTEKVPKIKNPESKEVKRKKGVMACKTAKEESNEVPEMEADTEISVKSSSNPTDRRPEKVKNRQNKKSCETESEDCFVTLKEAVVKISAMLSEISEDKNFFVSGENGENPRHVDTKTLKEFSGVIKEMSGVAKELFGSGSDVADGLIIEFSEDVSQCGQ